MARHNLPVVGIIGNNGIWALEHHPMMFLYGYSMAAKLRPENRYDDRRSPRLRREVYESGFRPSSRVPRPSPSRAGKSDRVDLVKRVARAHRAEVLEVANPADGGVLSPAREGLSRSRCEARAEGVTGVRVRAARSQKRGRWAHGTGWRSDGCGDGASALRLADDLGRDRARHPRRDLRTGRGWSSFSDLERPQTSGCDRSGRARRPQAAKRSTVSGQERRGRRSQL